MEEISEVLYEKTISDNLDKFYQVKVVVSEFREVQYLSLRKYFQSYEGEFVASKEGISLQYEMESSLALLEALLEIIPYNEYKHLIPEEISA